MRSEGFLLNIAREFYPGLFDASKRYLFVFPNRRSGIYFKREFSKLSDKPVVGPDVYSMGDLVQKCTGMEVPDRVELIFRLFSEWENIDSDDFRSFADFYREGLIILNDFSDIDKNLADPKKVFKTLTGFNNSGGMSGRAFSGKWEHLGILYDRFRDNLLSDRMGYEGMAFREAAENIEIIKNVGWDKIIFCGFNALSGSEKKIISELTSEGIAQCRIEMDEYFMKNSEQEAGKFARDYLESGMFGEYLGSVDNNLIEDEKNIRIWKSPSASGQAKIIGYILDRIDTDKFQFDEIAIVLPDESLLFPVLNSIPLRFKKGNITLGFPLSQTSLYSLINMIIELSISGSESSEKEISRLISHPLINMIRDEKEREERVDIDEVINKIISFKGDTGELIGFIKTILKQLLLNYKSDEKSFPEIEAEFIYHFYLLFERTEKYIEKSGVTPDPKGFLRLFREMAETVRIPFTGEPLEGLQILGFIESQNLRFKKVIIPSMNDSIFPGKFRIDSFIPPEIRSGFGLTYDRERDAVSANNFYRLIKGAEEVDILYIDEPEKSSVGERSRFVSQVLIEYAERAKNCRVSEETVGFPVTSAKPGKIEIKKTDRHLEKLKEKKFSATSLKTYLSCTLKFYFRYIERIKEMEETEDSLVPALYGKLIHTTLEIIYRNSAGKTIDSRFFDNFDSIKIKNIISESFHNSEVRLKESGRSRLAFEIIFRLIKNFIQKERDESPFLILNVEQEALSTITIRTGDKKYDIKLEGRIDRIDQKEGVQRVVDYKTGKISSLNIENSIWNDGVDWRKHPDVFQLMLYSLLLSESGLLQDKFKLSIYPFRDFSSGILDVSLGGITVIEEKKIEKFKSGLKGILENIFSPVNKFSQTEDKKVCMYCSYRYICDRNEPGEKRF